MKKSFEQVLEDIFLERQKPVIRGRQEGPRRPERADKSGYKGRGYSGPGGEMKGRDVEAPPPKLPGEPMTDKEKEQRITEFESSNDWILSMILVALMYANPELSENDAVKLGKEWAKKMAMPRTEHIWREQTSRIRRYGIRAEASKIRRELFKLI